MALPSHMNALILKQGGLSGEQASYHPESLEAFLEYSKIEVPKPEKGQVLIRMRCSSVNPSDLMFIQGAYGQPRIEGQPAGFEAVGDVVETGEGFYTKRMKGRRVAFVARGSGSWAEYVIADAANCMPLRDDVKDEDGAAMIVNPMTAWAMFDLVKKSGSKAFIMSAGGSQLCKLIAGLASEQGYKAISVVRRSHYETALKQLGAAYVLNSSSKGFNDELKAICGKEKPLVFLDAVTGSLSSDIFNCMGRNARWVIYGKLEGQDTVIKEPGQLIFMSKKVEGFWLAHWMGKISILSKINASRQVQARFCDGRWKTEIAAHVKLSDAHESLPELLGGANEGKIMLVPG